MIRLTSRAVAAGAVILALSISAASCVEENGSRFRVGYATFFVEFYDPVIDRFGVLQLAYCARDLTFTGQIDTACFELPMVYSFAMNAPVTCTYIDAAGVPWSYWDVFYFWPGYIQEPACFGEFEAPDDAPEMDLVRDSMLPRSDDGELVLPDDRTLSSEQADLSDLRGAQAAQTNEAVPPGLSDDRLLEFPERTEDTVLGEPPADVNDLTTD